MSETLNGCPICDLPPRFMSGTQRDGKYLAVVMPNCDCHHVRWFDSDEAAIAWWNAFPRRADLQEAREIILEIMNLLTRVPGAEHDARYLSFLARTDPQDRMSAANTAPKEAKP